MLKIQSIPDKTYEERILDGIIQIPIYTDEWTNFNPSDPGITMLENLSLFETLLQNRINNIPVEVRAALLKMVGFSAAKARNSRILLKPENVPDNFEIAKGQQFKLGDITFETIRPIKIGNNKIIDIFGKDAEDGNISDFGHVLEADLTIPVYPFGEDPKQDSALYFICNEMKAPEEEIIFYFSVKEANGRNPFLDKEKDLFSSIIWELYTVDGFVPLNVKDNTGNFVVSGEIYLRLPKNEAAVYKEGDYEGYCIRATLNKAAYDMAPAILNISSFLFEAWQQETRAFSITGTRSSGIEIPLELSKSHYISVFCKEEGKDSYYQYRMSSDEEEKGRFFIQKDGRENARYIFDKERFGYGPRKGRGAIRVIGYDEHIMRNYKLGEVAGFDDQIIELPVDNIARDSFFIIAKRENEDGEEIYDFVRPDYENEGALFYRLREREGNIIIKDAGDFIGAKLFMGGVALTMGERGNIRAGGYLNAPGIDKRIRFFNPGGGVGGRYTQSLEDVRQRFIADIDEPFAAVTKSDYEKLVLSIPGLCIKKAKAYVDHKRNQVQVVALPGVYKEGELPVLSPEYEQRIMERLEERRLLTTRVSVLKPKFVPVNVRATVYVKQHYENLVPDIEKAIYDELNFMESEKNFGDAVRFQDVFSSIENVSGVAYVESLSLKPKRVNTARLVEEDVVPEIQGMIIPGDIKIETVVYYDK